MKAKVKDKYVMIDIINVTICSIILVLSISALIDIDSNAWLFPYIILSGAIVNILSGFKGLKQNNKGKLSLLCGILLFTIALVIFVGFGGF